MTVWTQWLVCWLYYLVNVYRHPASFCHACVERNVPSAQINDSRRLIVGGCTAPSGSGMVTGRAKYWHCPLNIHTIICSYEEAARVFTVAYKCPDVAVKSVLELTLHHLPCSDPQNAPKTGVQVCDQFALTGCLLTRNADGPTWNWLPTPSGSDDTTMGPFETN